MDPREVHEMPPLKRRRTVMGRNSQHVACKFVAFWSHSYEAAILGSKQSVFFSLIDDHSIMPLVRIGEKELAQLMRWRLMQAGDYESTPDSAESDDYDEDTEEHRLPVRVARAVDKAAAAKAAAVAGSPNAQQSKRPANRNGQPAGVSPNCLRSRSPRSAWTGSTPEHRAVTPRTRSRSGVRSRAFGRKVVVWRRVVNDTYGIPYYSHIKWHDESSVRILNINPTWERPQSTMRIRHIIINEQDVEVEY